MSYELLDTDRNWNGSVDYYYWDPDTGEVVVHTAFEADRLLDQNKALRNSGTNGFSSSRDGRQIAEIDPVSYLRFRKEMHVDENPKDEMKLLKVWLRRPENAHFRTVDGGI
jgi:hypothetical protein